MKRIILLIAIMLSGISVFSQILDLKFSTLPNEDHLSSSYATAIAQDTFGYIWIGTTDGLNRFDGYDFKVYKSVQRDSSTLISNNIFCIYNDSHGRLWIGSGFGLCRYNRYFDSFERIVSTADSAGLENLYISCINEDRNGNLYISTVRYIYLFNEKNGNFSKVLRIEHGDISSFLFDNENNLWIGASSNGGLYYYNTKSKKLTRYSTSENNSNSLSNNSVMSVALRKNKIWVTTSGGGINSYDFINHKFKRYPSGNSYEIYGKRIYVDNSDILWECDLTGLKIYDEKSDSFYPYYYNQSDPLSIKKSAVSIFQDRQGNYWTLHSPGGISIRYVPVGFKSYDTNPARFWHTSIENISAICEDAQGNLWLGNPFNGIDIFYWRLGKRITYNYDSHDKYSLGKGSINTIFRDSHNTMWIGTYFGGLQYFNPENKRFISYMHDSRDSSSIACNDVRSIAEDTEGNLWIVVHGKGLDKFNRKTKTFTHYNEANYNFSNDWAFQVLCDNENNIWVASTWGLNRLKHGSRTFDNFFSDQNDSNSLSGSEIVSLCQDTKDNIWIGTTNGLNLYDKINNCFKRINLPAGNKYICGIQDDKANNLWISTLGGIINLDTKTLFTISFDKKDDLLTNEFNQRAVYNDDNNKLFFGSLKGVIFFNPDSLKINKEKPKVIISNFRIFFEEISDYSDGSVLKKQICLTDTLILRYKQNIITFEFVASNLIHPEKNQYKYIMEGFDTRWTNAGAKREAKYTNLDPGKYTFRVKASNNDGIWNNQGTSLFIRILPPWYKTWWFYSLCGITVIFIFVLFYLIRTQQLRKQKKELTLRVEERTRQLSEMNELLLSQTNDLNDTNALLEERQQRIEDQAKSLTNANNELKILNSSKDKFFSIIAHDLRGPFSNILGFTDLLLKDFDTMDNAQKKDVAKYINSSTIRVYDLLENLLKWAASQTNKLNFNPTVINIKEIITENINLFCDFARKKEINIIFEKIDVEEVFADYEMVNTILRNLINNALKFTLTGGTITIEIQNVKNFAVLSVNDTGIGMDEAYMEKLFSLDNTESRPGTEEEKGSGIGLILCKEFVEKNGGKISVISSKGKGSTFSFTLPLFSGK